MELAIIGMLFVFGSLIVGLLLLAMLVGGVEVDASLEPEGEEPPFSSESPPTDETGARAGEQG